MTIHCLRLTRSDRSHNTALHLEAIHRRRKPGQRAHERIHEQNHGEVRLQQHADRFGFLEVRGGVERQVLVRHLLVLVQTLVDLSVRNRDDSYIPQSTLQHLLSATPSLPLAHANVAQQLLSLRLTRLSHTHTALQMLALVAVQRIAGAFAATQLDQTLVPASAPRFISTAD